MKLNDEILKIHKQVFQNSCVPSSVEMVLKLEGILEPHSFKIQEQCGDTGRSGDDFDGIRYSKGNNSIKFSKKIFGDLKSVFDAIKSELRSNKYVIVPLKTGIQNNARTYHNHVIYDFTEQGEYRTITILYGNNDIVDVKDMEKRFTDNFNEMITKQSNQRFGIDILVYERL
jgi:hypothetical protein